MPNQEKYAQPNFPEEILADLPDALLQQHGLNADETKTMREILGRNPSMTELGIFSVMWSEHCSYKSSRHYLKDLPTTGEAVICGPGENAGVVDIGGDYAAIFKMESHNHPSFIEPFQGAATGVGGILRDVFTMGARPIALVNALRFGSPNHPLTKHLLSGVVAGIGGYGNCMGIPTIAGETEFDAGYNHNILVNAMCVGLARKDKIFYSRAEGVGNPVLYVGATTGRDGIHGATMASAEFDENSESQKPTVQVGDPFTEKRLLEACMELMQTDAIIAIQDMGAAGLTSSSVEMADKGGLGIHLDLDKVPKREQNMTAYELMLSESQERMLMIVKPNHEQIVFDIFKKWDLQAMVIGVLNDSGNISLSQHGKLVANMPVSPLSNRAPLYQRPSAPLKQLPALDSSSMKAGDAIDVLKTLIASADLAHKAWVWEQYDTYISGNVITPPGADAAVIAIPENAYEDENDDGKQIIPALAMASDSSPRYIFANPLEGGKQIVAENWRNLTAMGAMPLAITNNLNFGNPENPDIMSEFTHALQGMKQACEILNYPVVSGNVSFYNETNQQGILPTPVIGGVGLIQNAALTASPHLNESGLQLYLIGETKDELGASLYQKIIAGVVSHAIAHAPPQVDLPTEKKHGDFIRALIQEQLINICHDVSTGGLLPAIARMVLHVPKHRTYKTHQDFIGTDLHAPPAGISPLIWWFSESQARYIIAVTDENQADIISRATQGNIPLHHLGATINGGECVINGEGSISWQSLAPDYYHKIGDITD